LFASALGFANRHRLRLVASRLFRAEVATNRQLNAAVADSVFSHA
jgi:hypothetical protein